MSGMFLALILFVAAGVFQMLAWGEVKPAAGWAALALAAMYFGFAAVVYGGGR